MDERSPNSTTRTGRPYAQPVYLVVDRATGPRDPTVAAADGLRDQMLARRATRAGEAPALPIALDVVASADEGFRTALRRSFRRMEDDIPDLQAKGYDVLRPVTICFASAGFGTTSPFGSRPAPAPPPAPAPAPPAAVARRQAIARFLCTPAVVVFGMAGSDPHAVRSLANAGAFRWTEEGDPVPGAARWGEAFACEALDVVGYRSAERIVIPPAPPGFTRVT